MNTTSFIQCTLVGVVFLLMSCQSGEPLPKLGMRETDDAGHESIHRVESPAFTDHQAKAFRADLPGDQILVMNYFFTSCPTICPKMTDNLVTVFDAYESDPEVALLSFSVDPKRDDPNRLRQFMASHGIPEDKNWHFLTGDKQALYDFARHQLYLSALDVEVEVEEDFIHSEKVVLVDKNGYIRAYYDGTVPDEMKRLKKDINRLKNEKE